jgi:hypothetical protein
MSNLGQKMRPIWDDSGTENVDKRKRSRDL